MPMQSGRDDLEPDSSLRHAEAEFLSAARLEAEEAGREAARLQMRSRHLGDVVRELMTRGDLVTVTVGDRSFTGRVLQAAGDLMTLLTADDVVDVNLPLASVIAILERARAGGRSRTEGPGSFRGRLLELEGVWGVEVGILGSAPAVLKATIKVAAQDHLLLVDAAGNERYVTTRWVGYVVGGTVALG